ncbi:MAG: SIMPL domain-containing protein [Proteobacteria bacterium]|jgi:uncharacterized protein|nr:SIMPL domain-containing protein [Pseudomonadota bacterium]
MKVSIKVQVLIVLLALVMDVANAQTRIIAVEGSATIEAVPDIIRVQYLVSNISDEGVSAAKQVVDETAIRTIEALVDLGVEKESVTSSTLLVEPVDQYDANDNYIGSSQSEVSRSLELVLLEVGLYNQVIEALVDAGVTEIESISPDVSNYDELKMEALAAAAVNAKKEAAFLSAQLGATLGSVHQIGKQQLRRHFTLQEIVVTARQRSEDRSIPYEFEPGTVEVTADIYVEFELE